MSLKQLRVKKKLTQKQVAELIGMDRTEYTRLENGKRSIELMKAKELANVLGVTVNKLIENL